SSIQAACSLLPIGWEAIASMVVTAASPTDEIGVMQERVVSPLRWTVQAPQSPTPQPDLLPFRSSSSRSAQRRGVSPSTSTVRFRPFTAIVKAIVRASDSYPQVLRYRRPRSIAAE